MRLATGSRFSHPMPYDFYEKEEIMKFGGGVKSFREILWLYDQDVLSPLNRNLDFDGNESVAYRELILAQK